MRTIETLKEQTVPYRPNRRRRVQAAFLWGVILGLAIGLVLVLVTGAHAEDTPGVIPEWRGNAQLQDNWNQILNRLQRERFHDDYEIDRRVYRVNPEGRDATGVETDGDDGD